METHNPAARLHAILSSALTTARDGTVQKTALALWTQVFQVTEPEDTRTFEVISRLIQLKQLIEETEESLRRIVNLPDRYFRPFERIRSLPYHSLSSLNSDIGGRVRTITDGDMTVLEFCSERLESQHAEPIIEEAELQKILEQISLLFEEITTDELDPELKSFILDSLESIRRAIYEYRIRGPRRLKEVIAEILANLMMNQDIVRRAEADESMGKFEKLFYRLAAVVSFATDGPTLLSAVKTTLLPGG